MSTDGSSPEPESPSTASDKENSSRTLVMRDKGKAAEGASKRKRTMTNGGGPAHSRRRTATQEPDEDSVSEQYDPDQSIEQRREVQQGLRDLLKNLKENGDEFLQADSEGLHDTLRRADALSANVKQTTEATIDSKLLVNTVDASYRKTMRLTAGNIAQGMDVDEFVSKCITYMRIGGGIADDDAPDLSSTQRQRRRPNRSALAAVDEEDDEENGDAGDPFNWEHIGRFAGCTQARRPATPGFLLGPLSVEKKTRKVVKRSAPFRPGNLQEVRPEVLNPDDIQKNENGDLAGICKTVLERLVKVQQTAQDEAETAFEANDDEMTARIMQEYGLKQTGGIDLLRFVVNPKSFGQTVENMFYVSFLIRDAKIKLEYDDDGFATLVPIDPEQVEQNAGRQTARQRHQAVFHLDMDVWRDIVEVYNLREPLIEHRREEKVKGPGARGWYS